MYHLGLLVGLLDLFQQCESLILIGQVHLVDHNQSLELWLLLLDELNELLVLGCDRYAGISDLNEQISFLKLILHLVEGLPHVPREPVDLLGQVLELLPQHRFHYYIIIDN